MFVLHQGCERQVPALVRQQRVPRPSRPPRTLPTLLAPHHSAAPCNCPSLSALAPCMQASLEVKAEGLRGDIEAARSQIVASPARLRGEVEHAGRLVEDARTALAAAHGETAALQRRREVVAKATKDVGKCLSLMGEVDGEVRKLKAVSKEVKGKGAAREERAAEAAELQEQVARMERRVRAAEEKLEEAKRRCGGCRGCAGAGGTRSRGTSSRRERAGQEGGENRSSVAAFTGRHLRQPTFDAPCYLSNLSFRRLAART